MISSPLLNETLVKALKGGKIVVIPTDTIYGIVGSALIPETVEKIYKLRRRNPTKPCIILISDINELGKFNIKVSQVEKQLLQKIWPNPVSVIFPCSDDKFTYLHRGTKTLAFRMPKNDELLELLRKTGPLVAPSANFEGEKQAETIEDARKYFGDNILYIDGGKLVGKSSTLIEFKNDQIRLLREGAFKIGRNSVK
ncbi:MAG: L-threonylcarbamoyladenylate synthase [Candidatus Daviesbacteria bacterium]|nr:L-threonylcarbamoyladenylate synthase [Candidatus Daviesbacteria bacterium]